MTDPKNPIAIEIGNIALGIAYIVQALKNQPGFLKEDFNKEIQYYIDNLDEDKENLKQFLKMTLK